jgi:hypothetical protein
MYNQQKFSQVYQWPLIVEESVKRQFNPLPPFTFHGVTARVFPLQADIEALSDFCDEYLNIVPPHIAQFRPAAPFVYLSVLHYEEMSSQPESQKDQPPVSVSPEQASAWVSQHEVVFIVPVERYRKEGNDTVFKNWAFAGPFIFVSDPISVTLGREVYGWQKLAARIEPDFDDWIVHPRNRSHLLTLSTSDTPLVSVLEKKEKTRRLLKIEVEPSPSFSQLRPARNPFAVLLDAPRTVLDGLGTMVDGLDVFAGLPMWASALMFDPQERRNRQQQVRKVAEGLKNLGSTWSHLLRDQVLTALFPDFSSYEELRDILQKGSAKSSQKGQQPPAPLFLDQFTLKQFYNANDAERVCYQALVQSRIEVLKQYDGGLLGDMNYLLNDPSGGFQISIDRQPDRQLVGEKIIKALGLKEAEGSDKEVAVLKPFYPFWTAADLRYGEGRTLCWRAAEGGEETWQKKDDELSEAPGDDPKPASSGVGSKLMTPKSSVPPKYVTIGGVLKLPELPPPSQRDAAVYGNKRTQKLSLTIRVYPLEVVKSEQRDVERRVREFVGRLRMGRLFDELPEVSFQPQWPYVYLIILNQSDDDDSASRETPWEVAFAVPVIWKDGRKSALALFSPFVFVEADNAVIIEREVFGQPTVDATLTTTDSWLREVELGKPSTLTLKTEIIPDPEDKGGKVGDKELLKIEQEHTTDTPYPEWDKRGLAGLADAQVLALEILTGKRPIRSVMLKWFLDAHNPKDEACYQAVVTMRRRIANVTISKIEGKATITIHKYGHYPIIDLLGLGEPGKDSREVKLNPISPFSIKVEMTEEPAIDAYQSLHGEQWQQTPLFKAAIDSTTREYRLGRRILDAVRQEQKNILRSLQQKLRDIQPGQNVALRPERLNFDGIAANWESSGDDVDVQSAMKVDPLDVIRSILDGKWASTSNRSVNRSFRGKRRHKQGRP